MCQDVFANLAKKMEARNIAQRYAIFFVLNSVTAPPQHMENFSRPLEMMQCQEHKPFAGTKRFSEGKTIAEGQERSRRPSTTRTSDNTARVGELVRSDRRLIVNMIADEANMNQEVVRRILTEELGMRKICAEMVPRNLTQQQRDASVSVSAELLEQVEADPDLTLRRLMSYIYIYIYIYGAPILYVSRSHTTTQHSR